MESDLYCGLCNLKLIPKQVEFSYVGTVFHHTFLCCPKCGQVLIPEDIARGRMAEVEQELEDK
ncbi:MAG TPA: hypothetical protein VN446_03995 [Candidatus Acidoferrum sp.]|nr:hypothetical protein [Candidatus Acidoferrum sp.]